MVEFFIGQRWVSEVEQAKGLCTVIDVQNKSVTVFFELNGEARTYSLNNCPLVRVLFSLGDTIKVLNEKKYIIQRVETKKGCAIYHSKLLDNHVHHVLKQIHEKELDYKITFSKPQNLLYSGQISQNKHFILRYKTLLYKYYQNKSPVAGFLGPRTSLIEHQIHVASEVANRFAPRVMLSDEVGMGKTIEAGFIIHHQLLLHRAKRVLIVVPESLVHQWFVEMMRRFNLHFSIFDESRCLNANQSNPFMSEQLVLIDINFINENNHRFNEIIEADWDLLVVDEAHHLIWNEDHHSEEYRLIAALSAKALGVILLTATPEQAGSISLFAQFRLLDPNRFYAFEKFKQEKNNQDLVSIANKLILSSKIENSLQKSLVKLLGKTAKKNIENVNCGDRELAEGARNNLLSDLLDRHNLGRIFFRNTRKSVGAFPKRIFQTYPLEIPELYQIAYSETKLEYSLFPELAYQDNIYAEGIDYWWLIDPRVKWLALILKILRNQKILLICARKETAQDLEYALRMIENLQVAVFHEDMTLIERDRSAAWFSDKKYGAQLLICSEIGSEGRNFQFAHHLILFDLPIHPDLLEQRIGRLDRIGQKEVIKIHIPYIEDTGQEILFHWYNEVFNAFSEISVVGNMVDMRFKNQLHKLLIGSYVKKEIDSLISNARKYQKKLQIHFERGRDQLLEILSKGIGKNNIISDINNYAQPRVLKKYIEKILDTLGFEIEDYSKYSFIMHPTSWMAYDIPFITEDGAMITVDRDIAINREDIQFFTWEHPIVRKSMEYFLYSGYGNVAVSFLKNKSLKVGTIFLETIYLTTVVADKSLQLDRYLPPTPIRCLIDQKLNDLDTKVDFDTLNAQIQQLNKGIAKKVVSMHKELIKKMIEKSAKYAQSRIGSMVEQAVKKFCEYIDQDLHRLTELRKVNPNVRLEEINNLKKCREIGIKKMDEAHMELDSLRVMIVG